MIDLFDRENERKQIHNILGNKDITSPFFVWIEGVSGAGKTQFLKYIIEKTNIFVFDFSDGEEMYKCDKINMKNEFSYISNVVFKILKNYPYKFQTFLQEYFDDQNSITFLDASCLVLPQLKIFTPIKNLIKTKYDDISQAQNNVTDKLINTQLIDFFSDVIVYYLEKIDSQRKHFLFCIDDMQWIDYSSLKTLNSVFKKIEKGNYRFILSMAITIRNSKSLTTEELDNYNSIFKVVENSFNNIHTVVINNFNLKITRDLIISKRRCFLEENIQKIYQLTNGNPLELIQTLRFSDEEVKRLINCKYDQPSCHIDKSYFTQEMVFSLYKENSNFMLIINILSILDCTIPIKTIAKIAELISDKVYIQKFYITDYYHALNDLLNKEIIKESIDGISISHDSMKTIVVEYIQSTGEYSEIVKIISNYLLSEKTLKFSKLKSNIYFSLKLLKDVDAYNAFKLFLDIISNKGLSLTVEIYEIGAECFCMCISNLEIDIINTVVDKILPTLLNAGKLRLAKKVSEYIFNLRKKLSKEKQIKYLYCYIKVLIEMSILVSNDNNISATILFNELKRINIDNDDKKIQILLLGMSLYEHLLDFTTIDALYNSADLTLKSANDISYFTLSKFYRNKGLILSHRLLTNDYKLAYKYSKKMSFSLDKKIMNGTTLNNLGLSYFYSGCINKAIICFSASLQILKNIGCETARILNNISICHCILGDIELAYQNISEALAEDLEGNFISSTIQTNYALILYQYGDTEKAISILDNLINIYYSGNNKCSDEIVYSAALLNRAYIHIQNQEYFAAINDVKESKKQVYRYEQELQQKKRDEMIKYCLCCENIIQENSIELDLYDRSKNIFKKPYSLMPFAFYVI